MKPNAAGVHIQVRSQGQGGIRVYVVTWAATAADEGSENLDHQLAFMTVDAAVNFTRELLTTTVD